MVTNIFKMDDTRYTTKVILESRLPSRKLSLTLCNVSNLWTLNFVEKSFEIKHAAQYTKK